MFVFPSLLIRYQVKFDSNVLGQYTAEPPFKDRAFFSMLTYKTCSIIGTERANCIKGSEVKSGKNIALQRL